MGQCHKFGAKHCFLGYRKKHVKHIWNHIEFPKDHFTRKGDVKEILANSVKFEDDSVESIDAIIMCTGYTHNFPFLSDELNINAKNRYSVDNLYENTVFIGNTKLFYMGMMNQILTTLMFDVQASFVKDIILGKILVPSQADMKQQIEMSQAIEDGTPDYDVPKLIDNQFNIVKGW